MTMRMVRRIGAAAVGAVAMGWAFAGTAAAQAEIGPGTVAGGEAIEMLIDCGEDSDTAFVSLTELGGASEAELEEIEGNPGVFGGGLVVPSAIEPGEYTLSFTCSGGSGDTATLTVAPAGAPDTGAGEQGSDGRLIAVAGVGTLGLAAASVLARRRRTGDSGA